MDLDIEQMQGTPQMGSLISDWLNDNAGVDIERIGQSGASAIQGSVAAQVVGNPAVQAAAKQGVLQASASQMAESILKYKKELAITAVVLVGVMAYLMFRKK